MSGSYPLGKGTRRGTCQAGKSSCPGLMATERASWPWRLTFTFGQLQSLSFSLGILCLRHPGFYKFRPLGSFQYFLENGLHSAGIFLRLAFMQLSRVIPWPFTRFQGTGVIKWGQKSKPQKIPGPKFNPPKITCRISEA